MSDLDFLTIADAARAIRSLALSPVALTEHLLERIRRIDRRYNAFLVTTAERALAEARAAEAEIAQGRVRGPLHGIPYALKDIIDVAGLPTTCHSKVMADNVASRTAFVARRLRDAGAILVGKLALHEFAIGGPTADLPWPPARNPWNPDHHPGGSSSGSAVAVAAGLVPAAIGTDTGGSVRNPATCCGIVGLKPTYGAVSRSGVFPLSFSLDHVGPMTRTVADNALLFDAIAGHDPDDPGSAARGSLPCAAGIGDGIRGLRIGVLEHFYTEDAAADPEMVKAIEQAVRVLHELGAQVRPARLSPLPVWASCGGTIQRVESYAVHEKWLKDRPGDYCELSRQKLLGGAFVPASDYIRALQARTILCAEYAELMREFDAVVTLSGLELPCRLDSATDIARTYERQARMPFNVTGAPAIAVPTGFSRTGLPLGMQIAARPFEEPLLYRVAHAYCAATGWTDRRPPVDAAWKPAHSLS
jgi:aspartyl-tRNA(Asn)/glutamyl-tRNA(Gln) amidotransferase subunit A